MNYLLDTDWIIHALKGNQAIIEKLKELRAGGLAISIISVAEIYEGVFGSKEPQRHEKILQDFLTGAGVIGITESVCRKFGELRNDLRKRGELIGDFDLLIASTALTGDMILLTENVKHYEKIKQLKIKTSG